MKKLLVLSLALLVGAPLCGLVWSEDPSITEEERQQRRELNARLKEKNLMGMGLKGSTRIGGPGTGTPKESSDEIQEKLYGLGLVRDLPEIKKQYNRGNPDVMNEHQEEAEEDTDDSHFDDED